jgi:hypothetical protein
MFCEENELMNGLVLADILKFILKNKDLITDQIKLEFIKIENMKIEERFQAIINIFTQVSSHNKLEFNISSLCNVN